MIRSELMNLRCHSNTSSLPHQPCWGSSPRLPWNRLSCHARAAGDDVGALHQGRSRQEVLSGQMQTGIADVSDIDRSAELFLWIWESVFGQKEDVDKEDKALDGIDPSVDPANAGRILACNAFLLTTGSGRD